MSRRISQCDSRVEPVPPGPFKLTDAFISQPKGTFCAGVECRITLAKNEANCSLQDTNIDRDEGIYRQVVGPLG